MLRDQFGLGLSERGKVVLQRLGNALMIQLAGAFQKGVVSRVSHECVLEFILGVLMDAEIVD